MGDYETITVGTDGSKLLLLAVERAASIAAAFGATLITGCVYYETVEDASKALRQDPVQVLGDDPARENLVVVKEAAEAVDATKAEIEVCSGSPAEALMSLVTDRHADLLVAGNRGINSLTGCPLGSVPVGVARQSDCDVMIVHAVS